MIRRSLTSMALLLVGFGLAAATPPTLVNYQGVLRSATGAPLTGSYDMVFAFYSASSAGTLLLTDTHNTGAPSGQVSVSNGLFTAQLGAGTIAAGSEPNLSEVFRDNASVYLEIQVGTETLSPRVRVTASAYAQNATSLQGVVNVNGSGNVGIGTSSQNLPLTLKGSGANGELVQFRDSSDVNQWHMNMRSGGLNFAESGVDDFRLFLKDGGNVGVGTSNPVYKLDVSGGIRLTGLLRDPTGDGGTSGQVLTSTGSGIDWVNPTSISDGDWTISGSDMYSNVSGNVGIGTSAPDRPMTVQGTGTNHELISLKDSAGVTKWHMNFGSGGLNFEETGVAGGRLYLKDGGSVGIGTTSPGFPLNFASSLGDKISLYGSSGAHYGFGIQNNLLQIHTANSSSDIAFGYGSSDSFTETVRIKGGGNVGIGTASPNRPLSVQQKVADGDLVGFNDNAGVTQWHLKYDSGLNFVESGVVENRLFLEDGGNVGIGTGSPAAKLHVQSASAPEVRIQNTTYNAGQKASLTFTHSINYASVESYLPGSNDVDLRFTTTNNSVPSTTMVITGNGKVGIGTVSPSARLTVADTLAVQGLTGGEQLLLERTDILDDFVAARATIWQSWTNTLAGSWLWSVVTIHSTSPINGTSGTATLKIYEGEGTGGTLLATQTVTIPDDWGWHPFTILNPPAITYNTKYTWALTASFDQNFVAGDEGDPYSGGTSSDGADVDWRFKIHVQSDTTGVAFKVNENGSVGIRSEDTQGYALGVNGTAAKVGGGNWSSFSDSRLKELKGEYGLGLQEIASLKPYTYSYREKTPLNISSKATYVGPVAQDVQRVIPQAVETSDKGWLLVNNEPIFWAMVNAIKELDDRTAGPPRAVAPSEEISKKAGSAAASRKSGDHIKARAPFDAGGEPSGAQSQGDLVGRYPVCEAVEIGDVLVNDPLHPGYFCLARAEADLGVVGISTGDTPLEDGLSDRQESSEQRPFVPVATGGIVYCKADATFGPILANDLLVTSPNPGHAMRAKAREMGTILGKAIEPLESGTGVIKVLVMLR